MADADTLWTASYYFDALPDHPPMRWLESYTGYLTRLAEDNDIMSVDALTAQCFPRQDRRIARGVTDFPPLSFGNLPLLAVCSPADLLGTTFHHLGTKFGRSTRPQPLSRFLAGSISVSLRYCPLCVRDDGYYSLMWRFLSLPGCVRHGCRFLDACGHCGRPLPLLTAPLRIGICPMCGHDMRALTAERLGVAEERATISRFYDLAFLLSPRADERDNDDSARYVGRRFGLCRRAARLRASDVAARLGITVNQIEGIERGSVITKGASFATYVAFADLLGLTVRDAFTSVVAEAEMDNLVGLNGGEE